MNQVIRQLPVLLVACLCACSSDPEPATQADAGAAECAVRADCAEKGEGLVCSANGRCERCVSDGQCELRERCEPETRLCAFKPGWGDECALNAECDAGELCVQGLCTPEREAVLCEDGECLLEGYRCNRVNGVCEEDIGCLSDADCSESELCNLPTNTCAVRCTDATAAEICATGQRCVEDRCSDCAESADCPSGLVCDLDKLQCVLDGSARCLSDRDCEVGQTCNPATGFCTAEPPPCVSDEDCLPDERCNLAAGRCEPRSCQPDRYERNDDMESAEPLGAGSFDRMTLCDREEDWFAVELDRGDRLDVFVDADPLFERGLEAHLLDAMGNVLAQGSLALDRTVADAGTYYLRLRSTDAWVTYGLRLSISRGIPCDPDRFEENEQPADAAPLPEEGDYDALTLCGGDVDFFAIAPPAGKGARVELHHVPTEGDLDLFAFTPDGATELARSATVDAVETIELGADDVPVGGLLIEVASEDSRAHNSYYLRIAWLP